MTDTEFEELTREVRLHNGFVQRMLVMEEQIVGTITAGDTCMGILQGISSENIIRRIIK